MQEDGRVVLPAAAWEMLCDAMRDHRTALGDLAQHMVYTDAILKEARRVVTDSRVRANPELYSLLADLDHALREYDAYLASTRCTLSEVHERAQHLTQQQPEPILRSLRS